MCRGGECPEERGGAGGGALLGERTKGAEPSREESLRAPHPSLLTTTPSTGLAVGSLASLGFYPSRKFLCC